MGPPRADIDNNILMQGTSVRRVHPRVAVLHKLLRDAYPRGVTVEKLARGLWPRGQQPSDVLMNLRTQAYQLNRVIRAWGFEADRVAGVPGINLGGYRLIRLRTTAKTQVAA